MKQRKLWMMAAILTSGLSLSSCQDWVTTNDDNPVNPETEEPTNIVENSDFSSYMDVNTYAGDDFYQHAIGKWLAEHPLKFLETENGTNSEQSEQTEAFKSSLKTMTDDEVIKRLKDDYNISTKASDLEILKGKVAAINAVTSTTDMYKKMGQLMSEGYLTPFYFTCMPYQRVVSPYLALPSNTMLYAIGAETLKEYVGLSEANAKKAISVIDEWKKMLIEKKLVEGKKGSLPRYVQESRLVKVSFAKNRVSGDSPLFLMFTTLGFTNEDANAMIDQDFSYINNFLAGLTLDDLKLFTIYMVANRDLNYIPLSAEEEDGFENTLTQLVDTRFSPVSVRFSGIYNKKIPAANRTAAIEMANEFRTTFRDRIKKLSWMGDESKAKAIEKLDNMDFGIGWPEDDSKRVEWSVKAPAASTDGKASFYTDVLDLYLQQTKIVVSKFNSKVSEDLFYAGEVEAPSYQANAYYSRVNNNIIIMSSNLVPPIFDPNRNAAINYAVLGATTIGHEITHGFDPGGTEYNNIGEHKAWMTPTDTKAFKVLSDKMVAHFNTLSVGDFKCDGLRTVDENTADLGGLYIGYDAYMRLLARKGVTGAELDRQGREFFRAFAYSWMANVSALAYVSFATDLHSPYCIRVNGNVYLMNEFYRLFNIKSGKMFLAPKDRIEIW